MIKTESILLGVIIAIASRYSLILYEARASQLHRSISDWVRKQLLRTLDGVSNLRHVSTIEALLLMSEWPLVALESGEDDGTLDEEPEALRASTRYDAYSWNHIGKGPTQLCNRSNNYQVGRFGWPKKWASTMP